MEKQPCELMQDLLPLYVEDSVNGTTKEIVAAHLQECPQCQELYTELKMAGPVLPDLKEDLPEADTFKKWSKRLRISGVIGLVLILLLVAGIGVISFEAGSAVKKDSLTVKDVAQTLKHAGLSLTSAPGVNPAEYKMGQAEPGVYQVKELDGVLFVYRFASIEERNTVYSQWDEANWKNDSGGSPTNMFTPKWQYQLAFAAKNTILVLALPQAPFGEYAEKISPAVLNLGKAVFYNLNGGEQVVYQGEGPNWKGKVIINYYNHLWTDDKKIYRYDGWAGEQLVLEYKGDTAALHGDFSCEFTELPPPFGETRTSLDRFDVRHFAGRDSVVNYGGWVLNFGGGMGGGGFMPQKGYGSTVTVKWNEQQETFQLKDITHSWD